MSMQRTPRHPLTLRAACYLISHHRNRNLTISPSAVPMTSIKPSRPPLPPKGSTIILEPFSSGTSEATAASDPYIGLLTHEVKGEYASGSAGPPRCLGVGAGKPQARSQLAQQFQVVLNQSSSFLQGHLRLLSY
jgi:hypothetical protein